ncbi:MAG: fibronectin type III domain-containing protein [Candidatus Limnocylindrales bacterium]
MSTEATAQRGTAPSAPRTPSASAGGPGITVKWSGPATNGGSAVTAFRLYRGTSSGRETFLASVSSSTMSYLDKSVGHKTRYFYWVTAVNVLGESGPSSEVNATSR